MEIDKNLKHLKNPGLFLNKVKDLKIVDTEIPEPQENEIIIQTAYVGICGSDVHYYERGKIGDYIVTKPMIMGHETSGIVHKLGINLVNKLAIGDRVAIEPGIPCRMCNLCKKGSYNLCPLIKFHATPPIDGTLRKYFAHPSDFCFKLPSNISLEEGALVEPLSIATYAFKRGNFVFGSDVLICGAGAIGQCCVICAVAQGAKNIYIIDSKEFKLKLAQKLGATHPIRVDWQDKKLVEELNPIFKQNPPSIAFETTGTDFGIDLALHVCQSGSTLVSIGFSMEDSEVKMFRLINKQIDVVGIFRYANVFPQTIAMLASGRIDATQIITNRFDFKDAIKAYETALGDKNSIKVMIKVLEEENSKQTIPNGSCHGGDQ